MSDFNESRPEVLWYVAHTWSGYENKVKSSLEKIIENRGLQDVICEIQIPTRTVIKKDEKTGEEKEHEEKVMPGYIFVRMLMNDENWHHVRNITGVTGFVGPGSKPVPLTDEEVIEALGESAVVTADLDFKVGDSVMIVSGMFAGYPGTVAEIADDKKTIKVMASMFGRETAVELSSSDVKLN